MSFQIVDTLSASTVTQVSNKNILSIIEHGNVLVSMFSSGSESNITPIDATFIDVVGTVYFTINGNYTPTPSTSIDNLHIYLPIAANDGVYANANVSLVPLQHTSSFVPAYSFNSDFPIVDDIDLPNISSPGILMYSNTTPGVYVLTSVNGFGIDTTKGINGTCIYYQVQ